MLAGARTATHFDTAQKNVARLKRLSHNERAKSTSRGHFKFWRKHEALANAKTPRLWTSPQSAN